MVATGGFWGWGLGGDTRHLEAVVLSTDWVLPFVDRLPDPAAEVTELRHRIVDSTRLTRAEIAEVVGVSRRARSGYAPGEIRPTESRLATLRVLAETAVWAEARFGHRTKEVLLAGSRTANEPAPADLIRAGHADVTGAMETAAMALGITGLHTVTTRARDTEREPLHGRAQKAWTRTARPPTGGRRRRDPSVYEKELSEAPPAPRDDQTGRKRRRGL